MRYYTQQKAKIKRRTPQVYYLRRRYTLLFKVVGGILLAGVLLYLIYFFFIRSSVFVVSHVRVFGAAGFVDGNDLVEIVKGQVHGKSIFGIDTRLLSGNLSENFQGAKQIRVYKVYPRTVNVEVVERVPLALLYNNLSEDYFLVDEDGYILGIVDPTKTNLTKIYYEGEINVGLFINKEMVPVYLELTAALNESNIKVSSLSFYPRYATVYLNDGIEVLIDNQKDKRGSSQILSDLLNQLKEEEKKVKKIDLRYDKVIVSFN